LNKNIELIENKDKELEELKNQNNTLFFNNSNLGKENRELKEENEVLKTKLNKKK
jgi:FtsZ-binding cell division protein ZapB